MDFILLFLALYFTIGLGMSYFFFFFTNVLSALGSSTQSSNYCSKLIILLGILILWPFLLKKYFSQKNGFTIGWKNDIPKRNKKALFFFILGLFLLLSIVAYLIVAFLFPLNQYHFERGAQRDFSGVYFNKPQPLLVLNEQSLREGFDPEALLIGYGELTVTSIMEEVQGAMGNLNGREIRLRGTLFYRDEKIIIELTNGIDAVIGLSSKRVFPVQQTQAKPIQLIGEIINPKCWFGSLKSNEGKVQENCTTHYINRGIPPMLKVKRNGKNIFYLLTANGEENLTKSLHNFVSEEVEISGDVFYQNGWNVLSMSAKNIRYLTPN